MPDYLGMVLYILLAITLLENFGNEISLYAYMRNFCARAHTGRKL